MARGILDAFAALQARLPPDHRLVFLAHSTTQATNALLEGDVAKVGILGLGSGLEAIKARADMAVGDVELAPGKVLHSRLEFLNPESPDFPQELDRALTAFQEDGEGAVVAAEGFSVDDPSGELRVMERAALMNLPACGTHEVSGLAGGCDPHRSAQRQHPAQDDRDCRDLPGPPWARRDGPPMVMCAAMGRDEPGRVRRRPVMTLLSGPAAGIAAALMF